jgi:hypothetical protein
MALQATAPPWSGFEECLRMEVQFALDEADLVALARHHMERSPATRRRYRIRWIGASLGLGLTGALLYVFFALEAPALYLGAFAAFFLVSYPYYYRWLVARTMRRIVKARLNPKALAERTLRATPEGLELLGAGSKTFKTWDHISGIEVTPERAFVEIDGEFAVVLPRPRLGEETFRRLVETIRRLANLPS